VGVEEHEPRKYLLAYDSQEMEGLNTIYNSESNSPH
jgi:hypothetical protein